MDGLYFKIAKFHAKAEPLFTILGASLGFAFFLMPMVSQPINNLLKSFPLAFAVFDGVTRLSPSTVIAILSMSFLVQLTQVLATRLGFPGGWDYKKMGGLPNANEVIKNKLYPCTMVEKILFMLWATIKFFRVAIWAFPFVLLAYFMRIEFK